MTDIRIDKPTDPTVPCPGGMLTDVRGTAVIPTDRTIYSITVKVCEPNAANCGGAVTLGVDELDPPEIDGDFATIGWHLPAAMNSIPVWDCDAGGIENQIQAELDLDDHVNLFQATFNFIATC